MTYVIRTQHRSTLRLAIHLYLAANDYDEG